MTALISVAESASGFALSDNAELAARRPRIVAVEPAYKKTPTFRLDQRFIPLDDGRTLLRLHKALLVKPDHSTGMLEVVGWGIKLPIMQADDIPRQIARKFLILFSKATNQTISEAEKAEWLSICDLVDVTQFSIDRSSPQYMEGTLTKKYPPSIEWHDGTVEHLPTNFAANFFALEAGDSFSAFVKIGKGQTTLGIDRISLIL